MKWFLTASILCSMNSWSVEIIAHRGASSITPENTLVSILTAIELNSEFVEIDIHMSRDGHIIAIHDKTVDRTSNGSGPIADMSLKKIKELDAGSWFDPKYKNEKIPTLKEVLELDFKKSKLILEIKNEYDTYPGIEKKVVSILQQSNFKFPTIYKSFSTKVLDRFKKLDSSRPILYCLLGPIIPDFFYIDYWPRLGSFTDYQADYYQLHRYFASKGIINKVHSLDKKVIVWDVHASEDIEDAIAKNVDIIETDYIDRVQSLRSR